jgi:hypothetical protein
MVSISGLLFRSTIGFDRLLRLVEAATLPSATRPTTSGGPATTHIG